MCRFIMTAVVFCLVALPAFLSGADAPSDQVFVGDKLTVTFHAVSGGKQEGEVRMAERKFPLVAQLNGKELVGTFRSEGTDFEFRAQIDDRGMTFQTGRSTYTLTSRGAANVPAAPDRNNVAAAPAGRDVVRLSRVNVLDPLSNNQPALRILMPSDWKLEGGVVWRWNAFYPVAVQARIHNPRGFEQMAFYPSLLFTDGVRESVYQTAIVAGEQVAQQAAANWPEGSNYMGFEVRKRLADPVDVLREYALPRNRKDLVNLRPTDVADLPEVAKAQLAKIGVQGAEVKAVRVRFTYDVNGSAVEEEFHCTLYSVPTVAPMVSWGMEFQSFRAPKGKLDESLRLFHAINHSAELDLKWYAGVLEVQKMMQDGIRQSIEDAGRLSKYIAARNEEITQIIRDSYRETQRVNDKVHDSYSQYIRGVERYADPRDSGRPIELPSGYSQAYISSRGEVILSNDPNFNPAVAFKEDWRELPKAK